MTTATPIAFATRYLMWPLIALLGAGALGGIAFNRGESINSLWLIVAAICVYALGYRFYSAFIAAKVLALDATRATPAERLADGRDFIPTHRWIVFGHHFAAIAGPGPLVGPTLAAQFGYLAAACRTSSSCSVRSAATAARWARWRVMNSVRSVVQRRWSAYWPS